MRCALLAAVALQKIHWVDGNCVTANVVAVVVHSNLLKSSQVFPGYLPEDSHYITGMTLLSFHYMLCFRRVGNFSLD